MTSTWKMTKKQRFKITEEMENIVVSSKLIDPRKCFLLISRTQSKIWTTMGEVMMPGNPFDLTESGIGVKPPRAKETL